MFSNQWNCLVLSFPMVKKTSVDINDRNLVNFLKVEYLPLKYVSVVIYGFSKKSIMNQTKLFFTFSAVSLNKLKFSYLVNVFLSNTKIVGYAQIVQR